MKYRAFICYLFIISLSCNSNEKGGPKQMKEVVREKSDKIDKQRCSFDLPLSLHLGRIKDNFNEEAYFKIISDNSTNMMQLFIFDTPINVNEALDNQFKALNRPNVFTAETIDSVFHFGSYGGKGVIMRGSYAGNVVKGEIKIFCFSDSTKGLTVIEQTIHSDDRDNFDRVEETLHLK